MGCKKYQKRRKKKDNNKLICIRKYGLCGRRYLYKQYTKPGSRVNKEDTRIQRYGGISFS
jgi:hypothetical protein